MRPGDILQRSTRLTRIQHLLHRNPRGLTARELADLCGVCVRTVQRDLLSLHDLKIPLTQTEEGYRYAILGGYFLPPVAFSLYEAMAVFLASRLALRQIDENNPHMAAALGKIAAVLPSELAGRMKKAVQAIGKKASNPGFIAVFENVAVAWSTQRRLKINYLSLKSSEEKEWLLEPYFVDMTGVGYSTYVIGRALRKEIDEITTFKLERIKKAEILEETFEIPAGLDLGKLLASSWGIMTGEETVVKLKFSPAVTRRVKESVWHPSQQVTELPDGGCLLTVRVGSTLEMTPWIRGWGADVEVLAPERLRQEMIENAQRTLANYGAHPVRQASVPVASRRRDLHP
ncbi:MAG: WYL domain-containing protein [Chloroflexi bacterium]|nr:WYL domain-containing protein [Chloroflexota bacterium]